MCSTMFEHPSRSFVEKPDAILLIRSVCGKLREHQAVVNKPEPTVGELWERSKLSDDIDMATLFHPIRIVDIKAGRIGNSTVLTKKIRSDLRHMPKYLANRCSM